VPELVEVGDSWSACHFVDEMEIATASVSREVGQDIRVSQGDQ
jgi:hypothetical protein